MMQVVAVRVFDGELLEGPVVVEREDRDDRLVARHEFKDRTPERVDLRAPTIAAGPVQQSVSLEVDLRQHLVGGLGHWRPRGCEARQKRRQFAALREPQEQLKLVEVLEEILYIDGVCGNAESVRG
jgi:hypothetical protein